ncbi:MAG: molybdopterin-guanine dinucleotide biosynthesis protein B [Fervidicoccaceae archaeon]
MSIEERRRPLVVAVVGPRKSGKTAVAECVISSLSRAGLSVGAVKRVHEEGFTIDREGKDSWRLARAGAEVVAVVAPGEASLVRRGLEWSEGLEWALTEMAELGVDVIVVEGAHSVLGSRSDVMKILVARDEEELERVLEGTRPPIAAVSGPVSSRRELEERLGVRLVDFCSNEEAAVEVLGLGRKGFGFHVG